MTMWLIGMMGSGKSACGRLAASRLGVSFSDTDEVVAERMGCSVAQLWGSVGEGVFREMEKVATLRLADSDGIVATGGGVVLDDANRRVISASQKVVWLEATPDVLVARVVSTVDRPLLQSDKPAKAVLSENLEQRAPLYADVASHRIQTDAMSVDEVAEALEEIWNT